MCNEFIVTITVTIIIVVAVIVMFYCVASYLFHRYALSDLDLSPDVSD